MLQDCVNRLNWIGYEYIETLDKNFLEYLLDKVSTEVKVYCNIVTIPTELNKYIVDKVAGEFLLNRKDSGLLELEGINFDNIAKVIQLGDTKVEQDVEKTKSPEQRFDALINYLVTNKKELLVSFRQLRW